MTAAMQVILLILAAWFAAALLALGAYNAVKGWVRRRSQAAYLAALAAECGQP
jgi:hypothetical protein